MAFIVSANRDLISKQLFYFHAAYSVFPSSQLYFFVRMPRVVFSDGLEEKLTALWAEHQTKKSGVMMKRAKTEKGIAEN